MTAAVRRPDYFNPIVSRTPEGGRGLFINALLPHVQKQRALADALVKRAMLRCGEGQFAAAWQDILTTHRLGRLVTRGACLIEMLVGIAIDALGQKSALAFLKAAKPNANDARRYLKELQALPQPPNHLDLAELIDRRGERFMMLDIIQVVQKRGYDALVELGEGKVANQNRLGGAIGRHMMRGLDMDAIYRFGNRLTDESVAACRAPTYAERVAAYGAFESELKAVQGEIKAGGLSAATARKYGLSGDATQRIGVAVVVLLLPAVEKVMRAVERGLQNFDSEQIALALAAYHADQGEYPATLDELAPKYIASVPGRPFQRQAVGVRSAGGRLPLLQRRRERGRRLRPGRARHAARRRPERDDAEP